VGKAKKEVLLVRKQDLPSGVQNPVLTGHFFADFRIWCPDKTDCAAKARWGPLDVSAINFHE